MRVARGKFIVLDQEAWSMSARTRNRSIAAACRRASRLQFGV
jgi:hypothetical protein